MSSPSGARPTGDRRPSGERPRAFERLGRGIVRHPWYPVIIWIALLIVAVPFLSHLGTVTQNSATDLPSSAPSSQASHAIETLFPNESARGETLVVLTGPNITGALGQRVTLAVADGIRSDPRLSEIDGVTTVYDAYAGYLAGMTSLALGVVSASDPGATSYQAMNASAARIWGPPASFVQTWSSLVAAHP